MEAGPADYLRVPTSETSSPTSSLDDLDDNVPSSSTDSRPSKSVEEGQINENSENGSVTRRYRLIAVHLCGHHRLLLANDLTPCSDPASHIIETFVSSTKGKKTTIPALDENVPLEEGKAVYCAQCSTCESRAKAVSEEEELRFQQSTSCCLPLKSPDRPSLQLFSSILRHRGHFLQPTLRQAVPLATSSNAEWNDYCGLKDLIEGLVNGIASGTIVDDEGLEANLPLPESVQSHSRRDFHKIKALLRLKPRQNPNIPELDSDSRLRLRLEVYSTSVEEEAPEHEAPEHEAPEHDIPSVPLVTITRASSLRAPPAPVEPGPCENVHRWTGTEADHLEYAPEDLPFKGAKFSPYVPLHSNANATASASQPVPATELQTEREHQAQTPEGELHEAQPNQSSGEANMAISGDSAGIDDEPRHLKARVSRLFETLRQKRTSLCSGATPVLNTATLSQTGAAHSTPDLQSHECSSRRQRFASYLSASMNRRHCANALIELSNQPTTSGEQAAPCADAQNEPHAEVNNGQEHRATEVDPVQTNNRQTSNIETVMMEQMGEVNPAETCANGETASASSKYSDTIGPREGVSADNGDTQSSGARADDERSDTSNRSSAPSNVFLPLITNSDVSTSSCPPRLNGIQNQNRSQGIVINNETARHGGSDQNKFLKRVASENTLQCQASTSGNTGRRPRKRRSVVRHEVNHWANGLEYGDTETPSNENEHQTHETIDETMEGWNQAMEAMEEVYGSQSEDVQISKAHAEDDQEAGGSHAGENDNP